MEKELFEASCNDIRAEYANLGHSLGYRFLMCPKVAFSSKIEIALITLNPGGKVNSQSHPSESCEQGNAYFHETWPGFSKGASPLQNQIQLLFRDLHSRYKYPVSLDEFADTKVLSAYYIPFRSPSIKELPKKAESGSFAKRIWTRIFQKILPKVIVTIDRETNKDICSIMFQDLKGRILEAKEFPSGWGDYKLYSSRFAMGDGKVVTVARFPHFSTFKLYTSAPCQPFLDSFLDYVII